MMNAIELREFNCYYRYKKDFVHVLKNVTLSIESGAFVAVVGESGAGKSTFLKACLGLADAFEGELMIDGIPIDSFDLKNANHAYVSQELALYPKMTVYENIAFPLRVMHTPQEQVDVRVKELADFLDIRFLLTRKPSQLSVGQQQRVAIAKALIKNPTHLYFDEPFANLDGIMRMQLRQLVKDIYQKFRPTILFVTHDLQEAFSMAQRILVLENGQLVEDGSVEQLRHCAKSELFRGWEYDR